MASYSPALNMVFQRVHISLAEYCCANGLNTEQLDRSAHLPQTQTKTSTQPKRRALPPELPRIEIYHEPEDLQCNCGCALKRIGEDVTEKLDYIPGTAQVERHIRGKWVCKECETLTQSPMPDHVIDNGHFVSLAV